MNLPERAALSRRKFVLAAGATAAVLPSVACTQQPGEPAGTSATALTGTVTFMHNRNVEERVTVQEMVDAFAARNQGLTVDVVAQAGQFRPKLQTLFAAGTPPDLYYSMPESYGFFVQNGQMGSLTPLIKRDRYDLSDFFPGSVAQYQIRGETYALPRGFAPNTFYVNLELFKRAGAPLPAMDWKDTAWTWTKFLEVANQVTVRSGDEVVQHAILAPVSFRDYASYIYTGGGELWDREGKESRMTQPRTVEALQFIADLMHRYRVAPTPADLKQMTADVRWTNRKIAITHGSASRFSEWQRAGLDFDVAVPPLGAAPKRVIAGGGLAYSLTKGTKQQAAAWELLKWMTGKEMQLKEVLAGIVFPPRRSIAKSPAYLKPNQPPAHAALTVEAADSYMLVTPPFTNWDGITDILDKELSVLWEGQDSARNVAAKIKPQIDALLKESPTPV